MFLDRFTIQQKNVKLKKVNILLQLVGGLLIYSLIIPLVFGHIIAWISQHIYFSIYDIPMLKFRDYVTLDRSKLKKLNLLEKINCAYCGYANATVAWVKDSVNRLETYSCAIKHNVSKPGQEHQEKFHEYNEFN